MSSLASASYPGLSVFDLCGTHAENWDWPHSGALRTGTGFLCFNNSLYTFYYICRSIHATDMEFVAHNAEHPILTTNVN